jgi:hypothetical protein
MDSRELYWSHRNKFMDGGDEASNSELDVVFPSTSL